MTPGPSLLPATTRDVIWLLRAMGQYYRFEKLPFDRGNARRRLKDLLATPSLGYVAIIQVGRRRVGYVVVIRGFGLEHGRNAMIDELFVGPTARGKGIGGQVVERIASDLAAQGIESLHADVEKGNRDARAFWTKRGFKTYDRYAMVRMLATSAAARGSARRSSSH